jgi:hypothetical protein
VLNWLFSLGNENWEFYELLAKITGTQTYDVMNREDVNYHAAACAQEIMDSIRLSLILVALGYIAQQSMRVTSLSYCY